MSVHRQRYEPYRGKLTRERFRFLVLTRYGVAGVLASRFVVVFLVVAAVPLLAAGAIIYLSHSSVARALLGIVKVGSFMRVDTAFFQSMLSSQCFCGIILAAWVGPSLITADLANGALQLYFSRPVSRFEYALGKANVLVLLLSAITWIPGLVLYALNAAFSGGGWAVAHWRIALAIFVGSALWIVVVTLCVLSLSTLAKSRLGASVVLFAVYFVSAGIGELLANLLRLSWGRLLGFSHLFDVIWARLFGVPPEVPAPSSAAWLIVLGLCAASISILGRKLRVREVIS